MVGLLYVPQMVCDHLISTQLGISRPWGQRGRLISQMALFLLWSEETAKAVWIGVYRQSHLYLPTYRFMTVPIDVGSS